MAKILVIEDDIALQEAYSFILKSAGHRVKSVYDGQEGLAATRTETFDVILLDMLMPVMDGLEFLEEFHKHHPAHTKVIFFSNMLEPEVERQATELGAYRCVLKSSTTPAAMLALVAEAANDAPPSAKK